MEYRQITLDEAMHELSVDSANKKNIKSASNSKEKTNKIECPYILERISKCKSFNEFVTWCPFYKIYAMRDRYYYPWECMECNGNLITIKNTNKMPEDGSLILILSGENEYTANLIYVDDLWNTWTSTIKIKTEYVLCDWLTREEREQKNAVKSFSISKWKLLNKLLSFPSSWQDRDNLLSILSEEKPWVYEFITENNVNLYNYLMAPQLEQLHKAGYAFASKFFDMSIFVCKTDIECFNRICQIGNDIKSIFKVPSEVYSVLKGCNNIVTWDLYRKLFKAGKIKQDTIKQAYDNNFSDKDLRQLNNILNKQCNGHLVFTWDSLMNYLARLDQFEAIEREEALMLLSDYLMSCQLLGIEPKVDGDSLKREHDVAARLVRQKKDEKLTADMVKPCKYMQQFNYQDNNYLIRGVESWDDLIDEAKQQHNCVAAYAKKIATRKSLIYVMRRVVAPEKSLVTVELSPDGQVIRQKFKAYNKPINNGEQSAFLDKWLEFVQNKMTIKETKVA